MNPQVSRFLFLCTVLLAVWGCEKPFTQLIQYPSENESNRIVFSPSIEQSETKSTGGWNSTEIEMECHSGVLKEKTFGQSWVATRSIGMVTNTIPSGSSFGVLGYTVSGGVWNNSIQKPEYIYNEKITHTGTNYTYDTPIYWASDPVRFYAYYPYATNSGVNGISLSDKEVTGFPRIEFQAQNNVTEQIDYLVAATTVMNASSNVPLNFRHALTQIGFSFRSKDISGNVTVTDVELYNVVHKGVQTFDNANNIVWELEYDSVRNYAATILNGGLRNDVVLNETYQQVTSENGFMMLIPQQIKAGRVLMVIKYTVDGFKKELKAVLNVPAPGSAGEWSAGKRINYRITLSAQVNEFVIIPGIVGSANSFILNSHSRTNDPTVDYINFSLPVTRVNEYYNNPVYAGFYGSETGLDSDTRWGVKIIWMDMASLVEITKRTGTGYDPGNDPSNADSYIYREEPDTNRYNDRARIWVRCRIGVHGNALIGLFKDPNGNGIKDEGEEYLWSWHLWITDYNPNLFTNGTIANVPIESGAGRWEVHGGWVHRYATGTNGTDLFGNRQAWTPTTGIYRGLVMMDRNIGSFSDGYPELQDGFADRPLGALYYQYGRKDPFLSYAYRYYEDGTSINQTYTVTTGTKFYNIQELVNHPEIFPCSGSSGNRLAWASNLPTNVSCNWFDPKSEASNPVTDFTFPKSIFDPSPYGWKIPVNGTWSGLTLQNTPFQTGFGRIYNAGNGTQVNFPAYGFRAASDGEFKQIGIQGVVWSCSTDNNTPPDAQTGRSFYFFRGGNTDALFQATASGFTTDALSIRPIQDPVDPYPINRYP